MTAAEFAAAYGSTAEAVSAGTGIDPAVLLAQWANETSWGTVVFGNNLGNIRCSPTSFCQYATLGDFAAACVATFHNGYYQPVLSAVGAAAQLAAIVASPWSGGHYGGSLQAFYDPIAEVFDMTDAEKQLMFSKLDAILEATQGGYAIVTATGVQVDTALWAAIKQQFAQVDAAITAIKPVAGGSTDLTPVLTAIAQLKAQLAALTLKAV